MKELVDAEGANYGDDWTHYGATWSPGMDYRDGLAELVRRIVVSEPPRGEYDYGDGF